MPSLSLSSATAASAAADAATCEGGRVPGLESLFSKEIGCLTRARSCWEMGTAGNEHAAEIWQPCDCSMRCSGHAGRIGVCAQRFESRGNGGAGGYGRCGNAAGCEMRVQCAGGRGHGPMCARRAWAAASILTACSVTEAKLRLECACTRACTRRAAAAYGVAYLAAVDPRSTLLQRPEGYPRWF